MINYDNTVIVKSKLMNLAKVSALTAVSIRMLRYYEKVGLLKPMRGLNNYRIYSDDDIHIINKIKILNDAGFTLKMIQTLLPCFDLNKKSFHLCPSISENLKQALTQITEQIEKLKKSEKLLSSFLDNGLESND